MSYGITSDNIHLSELIPTPDDTNFAVNCNLSSPAGFTVNCTDPDILRFVEAATSQNTRRAYQSDVGHFLNWGGRIPANPHLVARYMAANAENLSIATLARRIVAIRRAHVLIGLPDPTKAELVRLTIRGIRRRLGRPQRRVAPLTIEQLAEIVSRLGNSTRDVRDRALLLVGFAGAFRRSELTAVDYEWIERLEQGTIIALRRSKTDQEGRGRHVAIARVGGEVCPVAALSAWLQVSGMEDGPLFRPVSKGGRVPECRLSASAVAIIVKQRAAQIGLDPELYSGHSLRAGFVTCAAAAGLPVWKIKSQTGHVSSAVLSRYIRERDLFGGMATIWRQAKIGAKTEVL